MKQRCPSSRFLKRAYLEKHKFVYDGYSKTWNAAVANIIDTSTTKDVVWGGLFEINEDNLATLDCYEGYSKKSYDRKLMEVTDGEGKTHEAIVYFRIGKKEDAPCEDYRKIVIQGAKNCELPEDYINNNL
ncbi:gamma-glutamylcyclotransferase [bacterium]|nr:gamma-glutamylcyclotransferase [bacterium]